MSRNNLQPANKQAHSTQKGYHRWSRKAINIAAKRLADISPRLLLVAGRVMEPAAGASPDVSHTDPFTKFDQADYRWVGPTNPETEIRTAAGTDIGGSGAAVEDLIRSGIPITA